MITRAKSRTFLVNSFDVYLSNLVVQKGEGVGEGGGVEGLGDGVGGERFGGGEDSSHGGGDGERGGGGEVEGVGAVNEAALVEEGNSPVPTEEIFSAKNGDDCEGRDGDSKGGEKGILTFLLKFKRDDCGNLRQFCSVGVISISFEVSLVQI
ncbi:keratin, type I cytoskeletal 9-like [Vigna radiata var. radiata]|uniref:Keratin, type I cytoskeletal 9-like n=1 Tax=Vigna radiata var. radiata TaxID=3916 RepID=A0A1S3TGU2_VIGRR|nr:keratin, type I cytoskeletal 9-like [Vigna radiata var. radiata]